MTTKNIKDVVDEINSDELDRDPFNLSAEDAQDPGIIDAISASIADHISQFKQSQKTNDDIEDSEESKDSTSQIESAATMPDTSQLSRTAHNPFFGECTDFDYDDDISQTILNNQWNYHKQQWSETSYATGMHTLPDKTESILFALSKKMVDNLAIKHFVGIQPMSHPCGLIFTLQPHPDGGMIEIRSIAVESRTLKLQTVMTSDTLHQIGANVNQEIFGLLSQEIGTEMYHKMIDDLKQTETKITSDITQPKRLATSLYEASIKIRVASKRGQANKLIAANDVVSNLLKAGLKVKDDPSMRYGFLSYVGEFGNMSVFCDHNLNQGEAIMCYKGGTGETDAGYFYCPYVMLQSAGGVAINPFTFEPIITLMTRYGTTTNKTLDANGNTIDTFSNYVTHLTYNKLKYTMDDDQELTMLFDVKPINSAIMNYTQGDNNE